MTDDVRVVKYGFLALLFAFSFWCMYTDAIAIYGFGSYFVLHTLFFLILCKDLLQDAEKGKKLLQAGPEFGIPLYWFLLLGSTAQFVASFLMIISLNVVYQKFFELRMSDINTWRLNFVKQSSIAATALLLTLVSLYWTSFGSVVTGTSKTIAFGCMIGILILSAADLYYASLFTRLIRGTTDG